MKELVVFAIFIGISVLVSKFTPVMISRMDFSFPSTLFYSKPKIFFAIVVLILGCIGGLANGDLKVFLIVEGFLICLYLLFIQYYFIKKFKRNSIKYKSIKIPAKIVGIKQQRRMKSLANHSSSSRFYTITKLIVEFVHPITNEVVEHISDTVTSHPFYSLKDLNVNVYYQTDGSILIDDFNRIKKHNENLAYKYTGKVTGKMPEGILRVE